MIELLGLFLIVIGVFTIKILSLKQRIEELENKMEQVFPTIK